MKPTPCALSISGFDPCGGAGILADLRAFAAAGAWGCAAIAVNTVQSTAGLTRSMPTATHDLIPQIEELLSHQRVHAIKVGALGSAENVRAVAALLRRRAKSTATVVDPVMQATLHAPNARLLGSDAVGPLRELLRRTTLVTPNAEEAGALLHDPVRTLSDAGRAAKALLALGPRAVLVKGGHLHGKRAVDVLAISGRVLELSAPRTPRARLHGTGCTLASLIAGRLALFASPIHDDQIIEAARWAKRRLSRAMGSTLSVGDGHRVVRV